MPQSKLRNFVFTWNNPSIPEGASLAQIKDLIHRRFPENSVQYWVAQLERGENGTLHFQGYCELARRRSFAVVRQFFGGQAHIEPRRGSQLEAIAYCQKEDSRVKGPWTYGIPRKQGTRTDIVAFRDKIKSGGTTSDLVDEFPLELAKFPKFVSVVRSTVKRGLRKKLRVECHWGAAGTGKTRYAWEKYGDDLFIPPIRQGKTQWFDGLCEAKVLLLDDFDGSMPLGNLLRVLDIYPVQLPVKGDHNHMVAETIIVTSNKDPELWYDFTGRTAQRRALMRRFHKIVEYKEDGSTVLHKDEPTIAEMEAQQNSAPPPQCEENTDSNILLRSPSIPETPPPAPLPQDEVGHEIFDQVSESSMDTLSMLSLEIE